MAAPEHNDICPCKIKAGNGAHPQETDYKMPVSDNASSLYVRNQNFESSKKQMISIEHLSVEFSARPLFSDACFVVNKRDRIALVGKNGAGKSTMLKIIAGEQSPSSGTVAMQRDVSVGRR